MLWILRVATDRRFGAGHFVRCRALAQAFTQAPIVAVDPDYPHQNEIMRWSSGIIVESQPESAELTLNAIFSKQADAVVFDSYVVAEEYCKQASTKGFCAVFRDGMPYGSESVTVDPSPGASAGPRVLAGPAYMPLDAQFITSAHVEILSREGPPRILVSFGARDTANRTELAIESLKRVRQPLHATIVMPATAIHRERIRSLVAGSSSFEVIDPGPITQRFYQMFDIAIGAPGVSQYERSFCGLPTILLAQNAKQELAVSIWAQSGAAVAGAAEPDAIANILSPLLDDLSLREVLAARGRLMVDGQGAKRLAVNLEQRASVRQ